MPFHRLTVPTYFGGLPAGYDYINDPAANGDPGVPAPTDSKKAVGPNEGTYFAAFGEDATSAFQNRANVALAENCDELDDFMRRDIAVVTRVNVAAGHGGSGSIALNGSVDNIYVGSTLLGSPQPLPELFAITDQATDAPIFVGGQRVVVTSITPDSRNTGDGFDASNPLTLTFNATIPNAQAFRVYYGIRRNLTTLPENAFSLPDIRRAGYASEAGGLITVNPTPWTQQALLSVDVASGGLGTTTTVLATALNNINSRFLNLRYFAQSVSDSSASEGGDVDDPDAAEWLNSGTSAVGGGLVSLRAGIYDLGLAGDLPVRAMSASPDPTTLRVGSGAASDIALGNLMLEGVNVDTNSATRHFVPGVLRLHGAQKLPTIAAGAVVLAGGQLLDMDGYASAANTLTTTSPAGLEFTDEGRAHIRNCTFSHIPTMAASPVATIYIHDINVETTEILFENCLITCTTAGCDAVRLETLDAVKVIFRNCRITAEAGAAAGWAVNVIDVGGGSTVLFDNCEIVGTEGQAIRVENSSITFRDCVVRGGTGTAVTDPQLICGYGNTSTSDLVGAFTLENVTALLGSANIDASGAPVQAPIELGGIGDSPALGRVVVDGLFVSGFSAIHNYSTVLLHGNGEQLMNIYKNITVDADGVAPTATGTLAAHSTNALGGLLVEVTQLDTPGAAYPKTVVENLQIINVQRPATTHNRGIAFFRNAVIQGLLLDGTFPSAVNEYGGGLPTRLIELQRSHLYDINLFPEYPLLTDGSIIYMGFGPSNNSAGCSMKGGHIHIQGVTNHDRIIQMGPFCRLEDVDIAVASNLPHSGASSITASNFCQIQNIRFLTTQTLAGNSLLNANADGVIVTGCLFRWGVDADVIAVFGGDDCIVSNNIFGTTAANPSTVTYPATGIGDDLTNVRVANIASTAQPIP